MITPSPASAFGEPPTAIDTLTADRVEMCHAWAAENMSKDPTLALMTAMPFGLDARLASSFLHEQGGLTLINEFLTKSGFIAFPGGNTGAAMGGWYHREITQPDDLKGLKIRSSGLASNVLTTLGATPVTRSANELRPALESRDIDGAHWFGPFDDDALGLWRAARYYYYPGWWRRRCVFHRQQGTLRCTASGCSSGSRRRRGSCAPTRPGTLRCPEYHCAAPSCCRWR